MTFIVFSTAHAQLLVEKIPAPLLHLQCCSKVHCPISSFPQVLPHPICRLTGFTFNGMTRFLKFFTGSTTNTIYMNQRFCVVVD